MLRHSNASLNQAEQQLSKSRIQKRQHLAGSCASMQRYEALLFSLLFSNVSLPSDGVSAGLGFRRSSLTPLCQVSELQLGGLYKGAVHALLLLLGCDCCLLLLFSSLQTAGLSTCHINLNVYLVQQDVNIQGTLLCMQQWVGLAWYGKQSMTQPQQSCA